MRRAGAVLLAAGALLLAGCHAESAGAAPAPPPSPATVPAAAPAAAPAAGGQPGTTRLDEVDSSLNRIEKELDNDGGR